MTTITMQLESMVARDLSSNRNSRRVRCKVGFVSRGSQYSKLRRERVVAVARPTSRSPVRPCPCPCPSNSIHAVLKSTRNGLRVSSLRFSTWLRIVNPRETPLLRCIVQPRSQRVCLPTLSDSIYTYIYIIYIIYIYIHIGENRSKFTRLRNS